MKNIYIAGILVLLLLFGCNRIVDKPKNNKNIQKQILEEETIYNGRYGEWYKIMTIDSCQYIIVVNRNGGGYGICHKQNCKYCEKRKND